MNSLPKPNPKTVTTLFKFLEVKTSDNVTPQNLSNPTSISPSLLMPHNAESASIPIEHVTKPIFATCHAQSTQVVLSTDSSHRLVIRGESFTENVDLNQTNPWIAGIEDNRTSVESKAIAKTDGEPSAALTDFLTTTFLFNPTQENISQLVRYFATYLGVPFGALNERRVGLLNYKKAFDLGNTKGIFAYGGQQGTALVTLPGSACHLINDWGACKYLFDDLLKGHITRWDGATDLFEGQPSVDDAVVWYQAGSFNRGGRKPSCHQNGNWIEPDGTGRTFYVGKRGNGKMLRIYEKGKQLGDPTSPWVRWELELHNRGRIIPWDVLMEPGRYLAGAYDCMDWVNPVVQERIKTTCKTANIGYQHLVQWCANSYGAMINTMLEVEGSPEKVIELLKRSGATRRLRLGGESLASLITPYDSLLPNEPVSL